MSILMDFYFLIKSQPEAKYCKSINHSILNKTEWSTESLAVFHFGCHKFLWKSREAMVQWLADPPVVQQVQGSIPGHGKMFIQIKKSVCPKLFIDPPQSN